MVVIGRELRAMYADIIAEGVPVEFAAILRKLDEPPAGYWASTVPTSPFRREGINAPKIVSAMTKALTAWQLRTYLVGGFYGFRSRICCDGEWQRSDMAE
jgi:hypothetical protein